MAEVLQDAPGLHCLFARFETERVAQDGKKSMRPAKIEPYIIEWDEEDENVSSKVERQHSRSLADDDSVSMRSTRGMGRPRPCMQGRNQLLSMWIGNSLEDPHLQVWVSQIVNPQITIKVYSDFRIVVGILGDFTVWHRACTRSNVSRRHPSLQRASGATRFQ
jgi:hypothetical protein